MPHEREVMEKEVTRKEDGRQLIYYRFKPAHRAAEAPAAAPGGEHEQH